MSELVAVFRGGGMFVGCLEVSVPLFRVTFQAEEIRLLVEASSQEEAETLARHNLDSVDPGWSLSGTKALDKPVLGEWYIWAPLHVFRWIRGAAGDDDSIAMACRRKWKTAPQPDDHKLEDPPSAWWRVDIYPMGDSGRHVGYFDSLADAKAAAEKAWDEWEPEGVRVPAEAP